MPHVGHPLDAVRFERNRQEDEGYENMLDLVFLNPWGRPFDSMHMNDYLHIALEMAALPRNEYTRSVTQRQPSCCWME